MSPNAPEKRPPLVSIAMPVRNNSTTLRQCLASIVQQTYPHWELLLFNDGSTDETAAIARSVDDDRIRLIDDGQALGLSRRLNQAIDLSRGEYFARMDGDDIAYPERIERQLAYLHSHPDVDLVGAAVVVFSGDGAAVGKLAWKENHDRICARPTGGFHIVHPTFVGRLDFFRRHRYRPAAILCEDQDLLLRAYRQSRFANVPEILLGYQDEPRLGRFLKMRWHLAKDFAREFMAQGRPHLALGVLVEQGLKGAYELVAISSGLKWRALWNRARPITPAERGRWEAVWMATAKIGR